jgi:TetR/AcrR family transcriptional regulator
MSEPGPRRGRTHDAEGAREAILNAAEEVFAEHGFDGARVDAIAAVAGYNKSLIFQYFEDKLGLYAAVIRRLDTQMSGLQDEMSTYLQAEEIFSDVEALKALLKKMMRTYFDYLVEHPRFVRILNWELAEGWQTFAKIVSQRDREDFEQFRPIFAKMQSAGLLRAGFEPSIPFIIAVYFFQFYLGSIPLFQIMLPDEDFSSSTALAGAREYIVEFAINGLLVDPAEKERQV